MDALIQKTKGENGTQKADVPRELAETQYDLTVWLVRNLGRLGNNTRQICLQVSSLIDPSSTPYNPIYPSALFTHPVNTSFRHPLSIHVINPPTHRPNQPTCPSTY